MSMKQVMVALCALYAIQLAVTEHTAHEIGIEMLQESGALEAADLAKEAVTAKTGTAADLKARNMVMLGEKEVSKERVHDAQKQLGEVLSHVAKKHPRYIQTTQDVDDFVSGDLLGESNKDGKVTMTKLTKILDKIDTLDKELNLELSTNERKVRELRRDCLNNNERNTKRNEADQEEIEKMKNEVKEKQTANLASQEAIRTSVANDGKTQEDTVSTLDKQHNAYRAYWDETEDSQQVRNILMQALWIVCYGFRSFRHAPYCTTLRKQPDFAEGSPQGSFTINGETNAEASKQFSLTMQSTWEAQKKADKNAANRKDADPDMEKGFVNNLAPWGVDPNTSGDQAGGGELSKEELAKRLDFLVQTSTLKAKMASPILDFVEAIQTGEVDEATVEQRVKEGKETLVDALTGLDRQEGEAQEARDKDWQMMINAGMIQIDEWGFQMLADANEQEMETKRIYMRENQMKDLNQQVREIQETQMAPRSAGMLREQFDCEKQEIEYDAIIEVAKEEIVNVRRLNSLLRFLVVGDDPLTKCAEESSKLECVPNQGTCTWWTRGVSEGSGGNEASEHKNGQDAEKVFCACEYGFYGKTCQYRSCPGFGRILYQKVSDRQADPEIENAFMGVCMNREICNNRGSGPVSVNCNDCNRDTGQCECGTRYYGFKCQFKWCAYAVKDELDDVPVYPCDGESQCGEANPTSVNQCGVSDDHGTCNNRRGNCECKPGWFGPHCAYKKCPSGVTQVDGYHTDLSPVACNGRGACLARPSQLEADNPQAQGSCKCAGAEYYGEMCEKRLCLSDCDGEGACNPLSGLCNCEKGKVGGSCVAGEGCKDCRFKTCKNNCNGKGECNRHDGTCVCNIEKHKDQADSEVAVQKTNGGLCSKSKWYHIYIADWTRSMDKWGWSICKKDHLMIGLRGDGLGDALYNLAYGVCAKLAEAGTEFGTMTVRAGVCYHENWWKKFDYKGGKFCRRGFFVSGLFRSHCNSLYCIEMAKCCQITRSMWNVCQWKPVVGAGFKGKEGGPPLIQKDEYTNQEIRETQSALVDQGKFIAGFYRSEDHTLNGLTHFRQCQPLLYGNPEREG